VTSEQEFLSKRIAECEALAGKGASV